LNGLSVTVLVESPGESGVSGSKGSERKKEQKLIGIKNKKKKDGGRLALPCNARPRKEGRKVTCCV